MHVLLPLLLAVASLAPAERPTLQVQTGHTGYVLAVAVSPDGALIVSGGLDDRVRVWDAATGEELRAFAGHTDDVSAVAFSPDGRLVASGGSDKVVRMWEVASARELRSLEGAGDDIRSIAFSPDGRTLAVGSMDEAVRVWETATGRLLNTIKTKDGVVALDFSPDGRTLAAGLWPGFSGPNLLTFDAETGRETHSIVHGPVGVTSVAFGPDGRRIAAAGGQARIWDLAAAGGPRPRDLPVEKSASVAVAPDGRTIAVGADDGSVAFWDVAASRLTRAPGGHGKTVAAAAFSPDGRRLFTGGLDNNVRVWDAAAARETAVLATSVESLNAVAITPDGRTIVSAGSGSSLRVWSGASGRELRTIGGASQYGTNALAVSPDGRTLAVAGNDLTVQLFDLETGAERLVFRNHSGPVYAVAFSADGRLVASGSGGDRAVRIWEAATGREVAVLTGHTRPISGVTFSPDGRLVASAADDPSVRLWDVAAAREVAVLTGHAEAANAVAFSPDGRLLASGGGDRTVRLWDVATQREVRVLTGHTADVQGVAFSPDGRLVASASIDSTIRLWDVASGREAGVLAGHARWVQDVAFSPDGRVLVSVAEDGTTRLWEVASRSELVALAAIGEREWLAAAPDGLFDGSPAAWQRVRWRFSTGLRDLAPVEAFFNEFFAPGLVEQLLDGSRPRATRDIASRDRRQPTVAITAAERSSAREVRVRVDVSSAPAGARDVRLFRNGSLVKVWRGDVLKGGARATLETRVRIVAGPNELVAYAFNGDDVKSPDARVTVTGAESLRRTGVLHVVAIGVDRYANERFNLKFAAADARAFAEEIARQQSRLDRFAKVEPLLLLDERATKAEILGALGRLAASAEPEDGVAIYFAGHGLADEPRFYLLPHDLGYDGPRTSEAIEPALPAIHAHAISDEEIEAALEGLDAAHLLVVVDACNSGQLLEAEEQRRGPMNSRGLAQLAYEKGAYVLTAAQSYQAALEATKLGHGFLTYALVVEGLGRGMADAAPKDGAVLVREWLDFATDRVPRMQQEEIRARELELSSSGSAAPVPERGVQQPRVFYRREASAAPLVVARP